MPSALPEPAAPAPRVAAHPTRRAPRLWWHLWRWAVGTLTVFWLVLAAMAYYTGVHEADEIGDGQLAAWAEAWARPGPHDDRHPLGTPLPTPTEAATRAGAERLAQRRGYEQGMAVVVIRDQHVVVDTHQLAPWVWPAPDGYTTRSVTVNGQTHRWRQWVRSDPDRSQHVVAVADLNARAALGRDMAEHLARPALVALPLAALLLAWALKRGVAPLERLSEQVDALPADDRQRLPADHRHAELTGTVRAINRLVDRLGEQLQRERQFASDIAHELRTPLTRLQVQAQSLSDSEDPAQRLAAARAVQQTSLEAGRILSLLLDFARAQRQPDRDAGGVDLVTCVRNVVAQHAPAAHDSGHVLSLWAPDAPRPVALWPALLGLAVRNLVDNALTHTPAGTQVAVVVRQRGDDWGLWVLDNAPPQSPPSSAGGLGLGLVLTRRIAEWHDARWVTQPPVDGWTTAHGMARGEWPADQPDAHGQPRTGWPTPEGPPLAQPAALS